MIDDNNEKLRRLRDHLLNRKRAEHKQRWRGMVDFVPGPAHDGHAGWQPGDVVLALDGVAYYCADAQRRRAVWKPLDELSGLDTVG
jgi:hypothetical protein